MSTSTSTFAPTTTSTEPWTPPVIDFNQQADPTEFDFNGVMTVRQRFF